MCLKNVKIWKMLWGLRRKIAKNKLYKLKSFIFCFNYLKFFKEQFLFQRKKSKMKQKNQEIKTHKQPKA